MCEAMTLFSASKGVEQDSLKQSGLTRLQMCTDRRSFHSDDISVPVDREQLSSMISSTVEVKMHKALKRHFYCALKRQGAGPQKKTLL